ncbi:DNA methyltransferase [Luteolibacter sp. Populi]|uniref:DNA methyltransferase n=1 Tax=Luteolibacter sp. Populi TaxID=3230487 RepID=UPI00346519E7
MSKTAAVEFVPQRSTFRRDGSQIVGGNALDHYSEWSAPTVIISDGPYGLSSYPGDPPTPRDLAKAYEPHLAAWSKAAMPSTTLWFWNSELGWATVHQSLEAAGWEFRNCHIWDKGIAHAAGNSNTKTLRKFPTVTEVCVQYVRKVEFSVGGQSLSMRDWLRHEWERTGLPYTKTNDACGVKNAATRKYFTKCHLWYYPPPEAFALIADYANRFGPAEGRPYFSTDGLKPMKEEEWGKLRAKFHCKAGITNVWREGAVRGEERLKDSLKVLHMNQKPLKFMDKCIAASSDEGDVVWEPFGGLCSGTVAAHRLGRKSYAAELISDFFALATQRLATYDVSPPHSSTRPAEIRHSA